MMVLVVIIMIITMVIGMVFRWWQLISHHRAVAGWFQWRAQIPQHFYPSNFGVRYNVSPFTNHSPTSFPSRTPVRFLQNYPRSQPFTSHPAAPPWRPWWNYRPPQWASPAPERRWSGVGSSVSPLSASLYNILGIVPSGKRYITMERSTMLLMGKSTISMAMASIANC